MELDLTSLSIGFLIGSCYATAVGCYFLHKAYKEKAMVTEQLNTIILKILEKAKG
ncbi:MAG: hypothetical protein JSV32_06525 [Dehalococcoidia bacterium]|nr:MAG: hypothetical protein JSV32_06525 [Dehalococcoidia bacterium]